MSADEDEPEGPLPHPTWSARALGLWRDGPVDDPALKVPRGVIALLALGWESTSAHLAQELNAPEAEVRDVLCHLATCELVECVSASRLWRKSLPALAVPWLPEFMTEGDLARLRTAMNERTAEGAVPATLARLDGTPAGAWGQRFERTLNRSTLDAVRALDRHPLIRVTWERCRVVPLRAPTTGTGTGFQPYESPAPPPMHVTPPRFRLPTIATAETRPELEAIAALLGSPTEAETTLPQPDPTKERP